MWPPPPQTSDLAPGMGTLTVEVDPKVGLRLIAVGPAGGERARTTLPYPASGYGGHEVVLGPAPYVALFLYSGQSEVGYEVFDAETLAHLGGLPYVRGEGDAPVFSSDGQLLAMAWEAGDLPYLEDLEQHERPAPGACDVVAWAQLNVHDLRTRRATRRVIHADLHGWRPSEDRNPSRCPERLRFEGRHTLRLYAPWGREVTIGLPLAEQVVVPGPE